MTDERDVQVADTIVKELCRVGAAVLIGAAIGAALGLLFAPKPGLELRGELRNRASELAAQVREKAQHLREQAEAEAPCCAEGTDA
jgi:gas vesicle protein